MADFDSSQQTVTSQETRAPTFKRRMVSRQAAECNVELIVLRRQTDADAAEATSFGQQHSAEHEAEMHAFGESAVFVDGVIMTE